MPHSSTRFTASEGHSPLRVFVLVLVVVFVIEALIMLLLRLLPQAPRDGLLLSLFDSVLLVAALVPLLWWLLLRPMRALVHERGELLARTLTVQEEVRTRIARDLHDELGQCQTAVLLGLRSVSSASSLEQARERVDAIHEIAVAAIESTRRMARGLSPSVLSDFGLTQAIERVCEDLTTATGLNITRDLQIGPARFASAVEIATYRIVQEGLTNAAKHSGASAIHVQLSHAANTLQITIADNGSGISHTHAAPAGLGLIGMRERMVMLGGSFTITTPRIGGTTIHASIPAPLVPS